MILIPKSYVTHQTKFCIYCLETSMPNSFADFHLYIKPDCIFDRDISYIITK